MPTGAELDTEGLADALADGLAAEAALAEADALAAAEAAGDAPELPLGAADADADGEASTSGVGFEIVYTGLKSSSAVF